MRLTADYHTHTVHSHGTGSVNDNVEAAIERGLTTVGIADHSVSHLTYGVKRKRFGHYIQCIELAKRKYEEKIQIKRGIELNLVGLDGSVDLPDGYDFDVLILGYHKAAVCKNIKTAWCFFAGYKPFGGNSKKKITEAYMRAIQKNNITIVAHPGYGVPIDYEKIAQACADYGTLFEINNKHTELQQTHIDIVSGTGAKFVISSDAHSPQDVGRAVHAMALAKQSGLSLDQIVNVREELA